MKEIYSKVSRNIVNNIKHPHETYSFKIQRIAVTFETLLCFKLSQLLNGKSEELQFIT